MTTKKHHARHPHADPAKVDKTRHPPLLPARYIIVKGREGGLVYYPAAGGFAGPLSTTDWTAVLVSPDIMMAIKNGTVEQQVEEPAAA